MNIILTHLASAGSLARNEMEDLRKAMPSIPHVLRRLHTNPENTKLSMFHVSKILLKIIVM